MTDEDKKIVVDYMDWPASGNDMRHEMFDLNDAGLVVQEMQKRGEDWREFHNFARNLYYTTNRSDLKIDYNFAAWFYTAENFFGAMAVWIKEGKSRY